MDTLVLKPFIDNLFLLLVCFWDVCFRLVEEPSATRLAVFTACLVLNVCACQSQSSVDCLFLTFYLSLSRDWPHPLRSPGLLLVGTGVL